MGADLRARAKEAYETALKLGEPTRAPAAGLIPSRLAELACESRGAGAPDRRARSNRSIGAARSSSSRSSTQQARDAGVLSTIATTYEELGDRSKALEWLAQAIKAGQSLKSIERSPWLKDLRGDERYQRLRQ